jgi:hypothetical protein
VQCRVYWCISIAQTPVQYSVECIDAYLLHKLHSLNYPLKRTCQENISYLRTVEFTRSSTYTKKKNWDQLTVTAGGYNVLSNGTRKAKCCCFMVLENQFFRVSWGGQSQIWSLTLEYTITHMDMEMHCVHCKVRTEFICYVEESRPPLWSSGQSSWLQNGDVLCFLWGTNW